MAVISQLLETDRIPIMLLFGLSIFFFVWQATTRSKAKLPLVGVWSSDFLSICYGCVKFVKHARSMLDEGYYKFPDTPFRIPTPTATRIIVPPNLMKEMRNYPCSKLSFNAAIYDVMQLKRVELYSLEEDNTPHQILTRAQVTPNIGKFIPLILDESKHAFQVEIGSAKEWKAVPIHSAMTRIVARVTSRIFSGEEICRNKDWINISIEFSNDVFSNAFSMFFFPRLIRPLAALLLPFQRRVRRQRMESRRILGPTYKQRLADREAGKPKVDDVFDWMIAGARPGWRNVNDLVDFHLALSLSVIYIPTNTLIGMIYDLAARPEYIEPLREEIIQVITEDGGQLKKSTLAKMMKLDSFMKESHRFNAVFTSFTRKAIETFDLSDGTHIPAGSMLVASAVSAHFDPAYYESPEEFDGFRFYKMRQQTGKINKHLFVSTSPTELNFGYGAHACPGRFFVANKMQLLLIRLLMKYDFKYPEGTGRPEDMILGDAKMMNTAGRLMMKERVDVPNWDFL
ncbi:cytochrome P450 [Morchella snyderi]|nr:cytochrome P450 [Morchella snyderi]